MKTDKVALKINLGAIANNYNLLKSKLKSGAECSAVVKANAYGLGAVPVVERLIKEGCSKFFVANIKEALEISDYPITVFVLCGFNNDYEQEYLTKNIIPVLNSLDEINQWSELAKKHNQKLQACIHIDTGINRLGLELEQAENLKIPNNIEILYIMSHLSCADEKDHKYNDMQLQNFIKLSDDKGIKRSFSNSSGIFLGEDYHFDIARPGVALYGGNPTLYQENPMQDVVNLTTNILQIKDIKKGCGIGYGASFIADKNITAAVLPIGYADGFFRYLGNKGQVFIKNKPCKILGRISMDLTIVDITDMDVNLDDQVEIIGKNQKIDDLAGDAGTISYEILTNFGTRLNRYYFDS